jgi:hypothetical protein
MSGRPYEARRFVNSVRAGLGLKPVAKLYNTTGSPITDSISHGSKTVTATMTKTGTVTATRGKNTITRTLPQGASAFVSAYRTGALSL